MVRRRDEDEDYAPSGESSADEEMSSAVESCDDEDPSDEEEEEQPVASSSRQPRHAPVNRQTVSRSALKSALGNAFVFPGSQSQDALESDDEEELDVVRTKHKFTGGTPEQTLAFVRNQTDHFLRGFRGSMLAIRTEWNRKNTENDENDSTAAENAIEGPPPLKRTRHEDPDRPLHEITPQREDNGESGSLPPNEDDEEAFCEEGLCDVISNYYESGDDRDYYVDLPDEEDIIHSILANPLSQYDHEWGAYYTQIMTIVDERLRSNVKNLWLRSVASTVLVKCGRAAAYVFAWLYATGSPIDFSEGSMDHDAAKAYSDSLGIWFSQKKSTPLSHRRHDHRLVLEPSTIVSYLNRHILLMRLLRICTLDSKADGKLMRSSINKFGKSLYNQIGGSKPLEKIALLQPDVDHICAAIGDKTPIARLSQLIHQFFFVTGVRPGSAWKSCGEESSDWEPLRVSDVTIIRDGAEQFSMTIRLRHEKVVTDVLATRKVPTITSRQSPFCIVRLTLVHLACMDYLKLPLDEAVAANDFSVKEEFKDRPLFCKIDYKRGILMPTLHMTDGMNEPFFDAVADAMRLPRWLISWRSYRKGYATQMTIAYLTLHPTAHKEDVILHLKTRGNWRSSEAEKYVDEILDRGYAKTIISGFKELGAGFVDTDSIRDGYPYAHRIEYAYVTPDDLYEEHKKTFDRIFAKDESLQKHLKRVAELDKQLVDGKYKAKEKPRLLYQRRTALGNVKKCQLSILKNAANHLNKDRFMAAREFYQWNGSPTAYPDRRVIDLESLATLLARRQMFEQRKLWRLSSFGLPKDIPSRGIPCWVTACEEKFTSESAFLTHLQEVHVDGVPEGTEYTVDCGHGCEASKYSVTVGFPEHHGKKTKRMEAFIVEHNVTRTLKSAMLNHVRRYHHKVYYCTNYSCELTYVTYSLRSAKCGFRGKHKTHKLKQMRDSELFKTDFTIESIPLRERRVCDECTEIRARFQKLIDTDADPNQRKLEMVKNITCVVEFETVRDGLDKKTLRVLKSISSPLGPFTNASFRPTATSLLKQLLFGKDCPRDAVLPVCVGQYINDRLPLVDAAI